MAISDSFLVFLHILFYLSITFILFLNTIYDDFLLKKDILVELAFISDADDNFGLKMV
jgi:hypothetical protein